MKLVVAIVQDYDVDRLLQSLTINSIGATRLASTGGFLRMGNTTVMMGVEDDRVQRCVQLVNQACRQRSEVQQDYSVSEFAEWQVHDVMIGGAVVFVIPVSRFERLEW